jgi:anti-sigma regulatory factor (Ser/Thr protein kinase)
MSSISIKSNTKSLMSALSVTFTDKTKVLSEIIQNSRRANASCIDITYCADTENKVVTEITITDDGIGIENMQDIFTIGGSGWDEQVTSKENPYGIGSIAMLYACQSLVIESVNQTIAVDCSDVIDGKSFSIDNTGLEGFWGHSLLM